MFESFFKRYLRLTHRHRLLFCLATLALFAAASWCAAGLELKSSLKELLPERSPSVVQLDRMLARVGGISVLTVAVEGPDVSANKRFVDDLAAKLAELPKDEVRYVNAKVVNIREFYENNALHYIDTKDLQVLYNRLKRVIDYEKIKRSPLFLDLGEDQSPVTLRLDDIRERNEKNVKMPLAVSGDYYGGEEGQFLIVMIRPQGAAIAIERARALLARVQGIVSELHPASYSPDLHVGYCGNLVTTIEEYETLKHDMVSTAGLCILLVGGIILLYFLRLRIVAFLGATLVLSVAVTFAITRFAIGYLNTQTAFLTSIIIGTGINYGIILIGRYLEERKGGVEKQPAMELALLQTWKPTLLAAATTAIAFLVLMVARVRGLSQFGFIGSVGVMVCWTMTLLALPPMVLISEDVLRLVRKLSIPKRDSAVMRAMDGLLGRFPASVLAFAAIAASVALVLLVRYLPHSIEYDFSKLRNKVSASEGTEALEHRVAKLWVGSMTPAVVLLDAPSDGPIVCDVVRKRNAAFPPEERAVDSCVTVDDLLPSDQEGKAPILARIDHLLADQWIDKIRGQDGDRLRRVKRSLSKLRLAVSDLPPDLVQNFTDLEGRVGTFAFINPRSGMPLSDGRNLRRFADQVSNIELPDGRVLHATGEYLILADLIKIVKEDAPWLTFLSFVGVALFVFLMLRRAGESTVILVSLAWGVLLMAGSMALLGIRINFFNFIALPLTFGIGVDYAVNVALRLYRDKNRRTIDIIRHTGGAVMLCSATTTIGYFVLTRSYNQAVAQFGLMAIVGEFTCLVAALFLVPALVIVGRRVRQRPS